MLLSAILEELGVEGAPADREITGVTCSTAVVKPGSLFFAIKGEKADGHSFIPKAFELGAAAAVGENAPEWDNYVQVENSHRAYALACAAFYGHPERKLRLCGVTGTNGKTTIATMIRAICQAAGQSCGMVGTVENIAGGRVIPAERTTPGSEELYALLGEMVDGGDRVCSMEVSSHALALERVGGLEFDVGIFTNLTRDHLDFHKTMDAYAEAKAKLMEMSRVSVINADDPRAEFFAAHAKKAVTYGIDAPADFRATDIEFRPDRLCFTCPLGRVQLPPGGRFSVSNALAAMAGALELGIPAEAVLKGVNGFAGVSGRLEPIVTPRGFTIYIDYAHTPDGLEKVLSALREFVAGRIITVFGCGGDRDKTKRPMMGDIASRLSDYCVVTNDNPRTEAPAKIIEDILKGMNGDAYTVEEDRKEAIRIAMKAAKPGDAVLLAGKGHETYQILGTTKHHMDERELVAEILREEQES